VEENLTTIHEAKEENDEQEEESEQFLSVECVGLSPSIERRWGASGGMDKTMKVWDVVSGTCRCVCQHDGGVVALQWHSNLPIVVTACLDWVVRLWDARSGSLLKNLTGHRNSITNLQLGSFTEADSQVDFVVTVSDDKTSRVFKLDFSKLI
jgi:WD40 repeat protein